MLSDEDRIILAGGQEPWLGIIFDEVRHNFYVSESGSRFLIADLFCEYEGSRLGIGFDMILDDWRVEQTDNPKVVFRWGDIRLRAVGEPSEAFVRILQFTNDYSLKPLKKSKNLLCEAVALNSDPIKVEKEPFCCKIYFDDKSGLGYSAQLFFTIDLENKKAWFSEKDPEYNAFVVEWFKSLTSNIGCE